MIEELIAKVFQARDCAHLEHWSTDSYSKHQALSMFYETVIDILDSIVETYQGAFGKIENLNKIKLEKSPNSDCVDLLFEQAVWIGLNGKKISREISAVQNTIDELLAIYLKTLYKLKELS